MIDLQKLHILFPSTQAATLTKYVEPLNNLFKGGHFSTVNRQAGFLSQAGFESQYFTHVEENLNYSAEGLIKTWPHVFTQVTAAQYAHQPIKIANAAYANKMGNGNELSGDGWKFRGRGLFQLTGHDNYAAAAKGLLMNIDVLTDNLILPEEAVQTAAWYWTENKLEHWADLDDIKELTRHVNHAMLGLEQRTAIYNQAKLLLKV
jgi:putative chitinase